ncbi:MAG: response regulator, partial [Planctomycetota bacterium]
MGSKGRIDVLVVDDEAGILEPIRRLLSIEQVEAATTTSPHEALELFDAHSPKVVISDLRMPDMNGWELLEEVRRRDPWALRILLTGAGKRAEVIEAINRGALFHFIEKPWDNARLLLVVREALDRYDEQARRRRLQ